MMSLGLAKVTKLIVLRSNWLFRFLPENYCGRLEPKTGFDYGPYLWEYGFMAKTTLDISESLMIRVKKRAAELRLSMKSVVEAALTNYLKGSRSEKKSFSQIEWKTVDGGLPRGLNVSDREKMVHWLRDRK